MCRTISASLSSGCVNRKDSLIICQVELMNLIQPKLPNYGLIGVVKKSVAHLTVRCDVLSLSMYRDSSCTYDWGV